MTHRQYLAALKQLGLTPGAQVTMAALGLSKRVLARLSTGQQEVPRPVALLIRMYLRHGLPDAD